MRKEAKRKGERKKLRKRHEVDDKGKWGKKTLEVRRSNMRREMVWERR